MRRTSCSSLSRVLSTRSSCSTSPTSSTSFIAGLMKILLCVQQQYEVRIWLNKHKETCYQPSHRTTNKHGKTRYRLNCHEESCKQEKNPHSFPERPKLRSAGGPELLGLYASDDTGGAIPRAAKFGRIDNSRAQSLNWDLWIGKQSPIRYRGAKFGSLKIRDETQLLGAN